MKSIKQIFLSLVIAGLVLFFNVLPAKASVYVHGYYRSNGTYVSPHYRSNPDSSLTNNYSYPGNTNPYTGVTATGNPSTYSSNYTNGSSSYTFPSVSYSTTPTSQFLLPIPQIVEDLFIGIYGKKPSVAESAYWKYRARHDKTDSLSLKNTMQYWFNKGYSPSLIGKRIFWNSI